MAILRYAGDRLVGLSTDAKPLDILDGATFFEYDTGLVYLKMGGVWDLMQGLSGYSGYSGISGYSGTNGKNGGNSLVWNLNTTSPSASGDFTPTPNSGNISSVTSLEFNETDHDGVDANPWFTQLKTWVDANDGQSAILSGLRVGSGGTGGVWYVNSVTDNGTTWTLGITNIYGSGTILNGAKVAWSWILNGASGYSGYSGYSGQDGIIGQDGASGYSGYSGISGYSGANGIDGASGYSGISGYSGYSGDSGISGYSGESGTSGYSGISGYSGDSGISGYSGLSGYSGYSGFLGYSGISGYSGFSGYSGISGYSGFSGASGTSGYSGYSGPSSMQTLQFAEASDDTQTTTTSATNITKVTLNYTPLLNGSYMVFYMADCGNQTSNGATYASAYRDTTLIGGEVLQKVNQANFIFSFAGHKVETLTANTTYAYTIQYRAGNGTATIQNARIQIWRVS